MVGHRDSLRVHQLELGPLVRRQAPVAPPACPGGVLHLVAELAELLPDVVGAVDLLQEADRRPPVRDLGDEAGEPAGPAEQVSGDGTVELGRVRVGELVSEAIVGEGAETQGEGAERRGRGRRRGRRRRGGLVSCCCRCRRRRRVRRRSRRARRGLGLLLLQLEPDAARGPGRRGVRPAAVEASDGGRPSSSDPGNGSVADVVASPTSSSPCSSEADAADGTDAGACVQKPALVPEAAGAVLGEVPAGSARQGQRRGVLGGHGRRRTGTGTGSCSAAAAASSEPADADAAAAAAAVEILMLLVVVVVVLLLLVMVLLLLLVVERGVLLLVGVGGRGGSCRRCGLLLLLRVRRIGGKVVSSSAAAAAAAAARAIGDGGDGGRRSDIRAAAAAASLVAACLFRHCGDGLVHRLDDDAPRPKAEAPATGSNGREKRKRFDLDASFF